jgi:hypothetical protein
MGEHFKFVDNILIVDDESMTNADMFDKSHNVRSTVCVFHCGILTRT